MPGILAADGVCARENCPSDKFYIMAWLGHYDGIIVVCAVCEAEFCYWL